jgi:hypothetical protein
MCRIFMRGELGRRSGTKSAFDKIELIGAEGLSNMNICRWGDLNDERLL